MRLYRLTKAWLWVAASAFVQAAAAATAAGSTVPTFNRDMAPIIFKHCATCHRPGQSGPFSLLTFADLKKHGRQIAEVTASRTMPPWLPERGYGEFVGDRSLTPQQIELFQRWPVEGGLEGSPKDLRPMPEWVEEWQLGRPDLIVQLPEPYTLQAEGRDVYRNVVIPIPTDIRRYVKGVEFRPGNPKVMHHAFVNTDETRFSRRLAEKEMPPGFDGMELPESAHMPGGQLLGWQPGKQASFSPAGLAWVLEKNTDMVLQMHLHPSGKSERVQPLVGFYFTDQPRTNTAFRLRLEQFKIDIPPGAKDYRIEQSYLLPVDVTLLRILPHAHYLGKSLNVYATLPDGTLKWLLRIPRWDFNWQGDYGYKSPVLLPKGTTLKMDFTYDNSSDNVRNPSHPPKRVTFGLESTDEMAACSLQVLPRNAEDRQKLAQDCYLESARVRLDYNEHILASDSTNAVAHAKAGRACMALGKFNEALKHFRDAVRAQPDFAKAYYDIGSIWLSQNRPQEAEKAFLAVVRFDPDDYQAHGNLAIIYMKQGRLKNAENHLRIAIRLNPDDELARKNLEALLRARAGQEAP